MPKPSSPTSEDAALLRAVAEALRRYKNGGNPSCKTLLNKDLAEVLGVSAATITNLLALLDHSENGSKRQRDLSGQLVLRALKAGVAIHYGELQFAAVSSAPQQIAFVFEDGRSCEKTADGIAVRVEKKGPASASPKVQIKIAG